MGRVPVNRLPVLVQRVAKLAPGNQRAASKHHFVGVNKIVEQERLRPNSMTPIVNTRTCLHCGHVYHSLREETPDRCLLCGCRQFNEVSNPSPTENDIAHAEAEDYDRDHREDITP